MRFEDLGLKNRIMENVRSMGFVRLTEIQERSIGKILQGRDVVGQAETGSGKTVAFALPVLQKIEPGKGIQALVLTPTRELCLQVTDVFRDLGKGMNIRAESVYGGVSIENQISKLPHTEVVVGTPGRILDHLGRKTINLSHVRFLILDEMDRMFDMGFIDDVEEIIRHVPKNRQTLMFSATVHGPLEHIIKRHLNNPEFIFTKPLVDAAKLKQVYYEIMNQNLKFSLLVHLLRHNTRGLSLVFCATREESDIVAANLKRQGLNASAIHGGMSQNSREKSIDSLKSQKSDILVATDVAARGLDIKNVTYVYNYDVPKTAKEYIHRIGRTARAGEMGEAITLLTHRDHDNLRRVLRESELDIESVPMPHIRRIPFDRNLGESFQRRRWSGRGNRRPRKNWRR